MTKARTEESISKRLEDNKKELNNQVEEILNNPKNETNTGNKAIENRNKTITKLLESDNVDYKKLIHNTHLLRDETAGVNVRDIQNEKGNFLVRDTRESSGNYKTSFAYQIQSLNMARSAKTLLNIHKENGNEDFFKRIDANTKALYKKLGDTPVEKDQQNLLLEHNNKLLDNLESTTGIDKKKLSKQLQLTMDYAGFEDDHYHIATISKIGDKTIVQADVAIQGYTEEQKKYFEFLKPSEREKSAEPEYFKKLDKFEQELVRKHGTEIASGDKVHNTQLRNIPGAKNAYEYSVYESSIPEAVGKIELTPKLSELRIGTLYSTTKSSQASEISKSTVKQLQEAVGETPIHFNTLVTPILTKGVNVDKHVFDATKRAIGDNNYHSNVAINKMRFASTNKYDGAKKIIQEIIKSDQISLSEELKEYLKKDYNNRSHKEETNTIIEKIPDLKDKKFAKDLINLKKLISTPKGMDKDNVGLEINSLISSVVEYANVKLGDKGKICKNLISCKSGKDRTGAQALLNSSKALENDHPKENLPVALAKTGHLQISSGRQGGRQGCFGILPSTSSKLPKKLQEAMNLMGLESANFNKARRSHKVRHNEVYNNFREIGALFSKEISKRLNTEKANSAQEDRDKNYIKLDRSIKTKMDKYISIGKLLEVKKNLEENRGNSKQVRKAIKSIKNSIDINIKKINSEIVKEQKKLAKKILKNDLKKLRANMNLELGGAKSKIEKKGIKEKFAQESKEAIEQYGDFMKKLSDITRESSTSIYKGMNEKAEKKEEKYQKGNNRKIKLDRRIKKSDFRNERASNLAKQSVEINDAMKNLSSKSNLNKANKYINNKSQEIKDKDFKKNVKLLGEIIDKPSFIEKFADFFRKKPTEEVIEKYKKNEAVLIYKVDDQTKYKDSISGKKDIIKAEELISKIPIADLEEARNEGKKLKNGNLTNAQNDTNQNLPTKNSPVRRNTI